MFYIFDFTCIMVVRNLSKNVEFVVFLKKFEKDVSELPPDCCSTVYSTVANHLCHLFDNYVDINTMTDLDINNVLEDVKKLTKNGQVYVFVVANLIYRLRKLDNNYGRQVVMQNTINTHLFNRR